MKKHAFAILCSSLLFAAFGFPQDPAVNLRISGISSSAAIRRDARGIPYIEAKNDSDLYFAQGYATATDRLWQMDLMRRLARGQTAEIFGRSVLEEDKRWRRFNFAKISEENLQFLSQELRAALESYARGVNAYISTLDDKTLPIEFRILQYKPREWQPSDTIVIGKILSDALSSTWRNDILRASLQNVPKDKLADLTNQVTPYDVVLFGKDEKAVRSAFESVPPAVAGGSLAAASTSPAAPTTPACGHPSSDRRGVGGSDSLPNAEMDEAVRASSLSRVGLYAEGLAASNNWVISGKRTADGKPILANDPHLAPTAPGIWYLSHLSTPTTRVSGVTFPGVPGIILGHNENIAWGATNVGPDVQDLYVETFNEKGEYKTPAGWALPVIRKETIKVRSNPLKPDTETVIFDVVETRHGPVITESGGKKYSLQWTAFDPHNTEFEAFYRWNRAKNWDDFKAGLKRYGGAAQNFIFADVKGNIGWYAASRIPIRRTGDGSLPYDGSTNDGDWVGVIPFDELPNLYNPPSGLIVTANQRIVGTSYKYTQMSRDAASPWRARRIHDELDSKTKITMDDVRDVQHDAYNIPLANLGKEIVKLGAASPETLSVLGSWDGRMTPDSRAALVLNEIRICSANKIAETNQPIPAYLIRERVLDWAVSEKSPRWLPAGFANYGDLLRSCDTGVRTMFSDPRRYGPDETKWVWGKAWNARFPHPLAVAPLIGGQFATPTDPLVGSGQTPNVGSYVSMRHIASPGNWDATRHVIPLGQSGDPRSPHYKDQFEAWASGAPMIFPFTKTAVDKATVGTTLLVPR